MEIGPRTLSYRAAGTRSKSAVGLFPDPLKKVTPTKSDANQADQKKDGKSPTSDAVKKPAPETKKVEAKK